MIQTTPAGATVDVDGRVACSPTPCSISFPDYYFRRHFTYWSQRLTHPVEVVVRKEGFRAKSVTVTEGPRRWQAWNNPDYFDYYNIIESEFSVALDPVPVLPVVTDRSGLTKTVDSQDAFVWFDEGPPDPNTQLWKL